ncbi:SRPBCC family protein [Leptolyngbya sp. FACHB-261]|uniref:SRPBCC family protein n=1 Tax=Leptolyngbya sp. FACHB-261 TaxID=2692806 RepID=UPI001681DC52|nr:SRPBCC family protein [Leptolyngbya sp. FACHB-261]MBD2101292.1 cyclase [Leptolyngbya sp. FACHB-261]
MASTALSQPTAPVLATAVAHLSSQEWRSLRSGEVLVRTAPHDGGGGRVCAQMWLPLERSQIWTQVTDYPRWVEFFPDIIRSEVRNHGLLTKQVYQVARKAFLFLSAQVEILLRVKETPAQRIDFSLERGDFSDFSASLTLADCEEGTLLSYTVAATPTIPVPSILIQQGMTAELPLNMRTMRQALCRH